jgi:hypothetical protein
VLLRNFPYAVVIVETDDAIHVRHASAREGHVDALRLRVTMTGLALAASLSDRKLRATRQRPLRLVLVA